MRCRILGLVTVSFLSAVSVSSVAAPAEAATLPLAGTFRSLHLRGLRAGRRIRVVARSDDTRSSGRIYARITQSRRRR